MHGQGNHVQFHHAPPVPSNQPSTPFQTAPPGPPPPAIRHGSQFHPLSHQTQPGPRNHQLGPPAPPVSLAGNLPLPPPPLNAGPYGQFYPPPYALPHPSYTSSLPNHSAVHVPPPLLPPRMYPPPPPPPSQGQGLYTIPRPPPTGIHHAPIPPPQPSNLCSVAIAPFSSFGSMPREDAHPPSLPPPPPPPPPSSPPPIPPSPPSMILPFSDSATTSSASTFPSIQGGRAFEPAAIDTRVTSSQPVAHSSVQGPFPVGESFNAEKEVPSTKVSFQNLPSPPPEPAEEVIRNIKALCQMIVEAGPEIEAMVRHKEAGNPRFAFLYGGEPGSDVAVAHEYFQWLKKKCQLHMPSSKEPEENSASVNQSKVDFSFESIIKDTEQVVNSPASSDMDMEDDDGLPDSDSDRNKWNKGKDDPTLVANAGHIGTPSHALHNTEDLLNFRNAQCNTELCSDDKDSVFPEGVSSVRSTPGDANCFEDANVSTSGQQNSENESLVNVSAVADFGKSEVPRVLVNDGSPFRLIQEYASDDSEDDNGDYHDVSPVRDSTLPTERPPIMSKDKMHECPSFSYKNDPNANIEYEIQADLRQTSYNMPKKHSFGGMCLEKSASPSIVPHSAVAENMNDVAKSFEPYNDHNIKQADTSGQIEKQQTKDENQDYSKPNLDEFGRLVREGVSDSDSDGIQYDGRHRKKGRRASRSRSPQLSRRRKNSRSPRQKGGRKYSPSHSPRSVKAFKNTKSWTRLVGDQAHECFNFARGRCFRGASCRFLHPEICQNWTTQKINQDSRRDSGNFVVQSHASSDIETPATDMDSDESNKLQHDMQTCSNLSESNRKNTVDGDDKKIALGLVLQGKGNDDMKLQDNQLLSTEQLKELPEPSNSSNRVQSDHPQLSMSLTIQPLLSIESRKLHDARLEQPVQESFPLQSPLRQSHDKHDSTSQISMECLPLEELHATNSTLSSNSQLESHVRGRSPSLPPNTIMVPLASQQSANDLVPVTVDHSQYPQPDMLHPIQQHTVSDHFSQNFQTPHAMWSSRPESTVSHGYEFPARTSISILEYRHSRQQSVVTPRKDFVQPSSEPHFFGSFNHSLTVDPNPCPSHPPESSRQPPLHVPEHNQSFPICSQQKLPFHVEDQLLVEEGSQISDPKPREHHVHHKSFVHGAQTLLPTQGLNSSAQGCVTHAQSIPLVRDSFANAQSLPGEFLQSRFLPRQEYSSAKDLPYSNHHASFSHQHYASGSFPTGGDSLADPVGQKIASDPTSSLVPGIILPKTSISMHYNPFASTFEQGPASSRFVANVLGIIDDTNYRKLDSSFSSGHGSIGGFGSRITSSPPSYRKSEIHTLPKIGGYVLETSGVPPDSQWKLAREPEGDTLYDPLFDSIEPSFDTHKRIVHVQRPGKLANDPSLISKFSSLSSTVDDTHNHGEKLVMVNDMKSEIDDFGEAATDAEVGVVDNDSPQLIDGKDWSPVMPVDLANDGAGEIEIDQVHSPEKRKKSKDSRSMKLFKISLADFVKEVLKPSWRQGNMSKEAFKTIVKKTVDKVSRSVPTRQIPKTQAKIDKYVESSQRKLTKLVMGYVDKYVKMGLEQNKDATKSQLHCNPDTKKKPKMKGRVSTHKPKLDKLAKSMIYDSTIQSYQAYKKFYHSSGINVTDMNKNVLVRPASE